MLKKTTLTLLAFAAATAGVNAQLLTAFDVSTSGSSATATPTVYTDPSVTSTNLARTTVTYAAANASFSSNNWNITGTLNTASNYISFDVTAGANPVIFSTLQYAINGSNTAPNQGQWAYTLDGGTTFTLGTTANNGAFTNTNVAKTTLTSWDFADFTLAAGSTVEFRFFEYGATSINGGTAAATGTTRIQNISGAGNSLYDLEVTGPNTFVNPVNAPEPSSLAFIAAGAGLLGFAVYRRNRTA